MNKTPKILGICYKKTVVSVACGKCSSNDEKIFKEKNLLINN